MNMRKTFSILFCLFCAVAPLAGQDTLKQAPERTFTIKPSHWTRGEYRAGALPAENGSGEAMFLMSSTMVQLDFAQKGLEIRFAPKFFGVWGSSSSGGIGVDEAWFGLRSRGGLFLRIGHQKLAYDDERIIGANDWAMVASTHDLLKAGYDGEKHKIHLLVAFNQNDENINGGTYYANGAQPYKMMQTLWYHLDPFPQWGNSLLFINTGMQNPSDPAENVNEYQQLFGVFSDWHPANFSVQASYYRQTGRNEYSLPINAWMTSAEAAWRINPAWRINTGYFYMSGDEYFFVPFAGAIGMALKTEVRGFNPIFGSHHKFYGAMDFFYVTTYYGGNTPGLQDFHAGGKWTPSKSFDLNAAYHLLATSVPVDDLPLTMGHELELTASWNIMKNVSLQAGYSFMKGTETMERLKRTGDKNNLHWGWLMFVVNPEFFSINLHK